MKRIVFPFAAVLGQEKIKHALLWNLVNPAVGGVLIAGEKGTAKSTLIRGIPAFASGQRLIELPINATEDRLVGAIDLEQAIQHGTYVLEPGILQEADGNILYADEVNLLSDHIVNILLETAANKRNVVEREGISCSHPCRFVLIGSMNPEEGKVRSQFLDRFGLYVEAEGEKNPAVRVEIMKRRLEFEADPLGFQEEYQEETNRLQKKIEKAKKLIPEIEVTENAMRLAAALSEESCCCGHRGELAIVETAKAIAAWDGRHAINTEDIKEAARYALPHRAQSPSSAAPKSQEPEEKTPDTKASDTNTSDTNTQQDQSEEAQQESGNSGSAVEETACEDLQASDEQPDFSEEKESEETDAREQKETETESKQNDTGTKEKLEESAETFLIPRWQESPGLRLNNQGSGRRTLVRSQNQQGRYVGYRMAGEEKVTDLAFDATLRAAAPFQRVREKGLRAVAVEKADMRVKIREKRTGGCILFVVDASASMGANRRMREVKAAILSMLNVSYQKRDRVGMIAFRRDRAELLLGITRSVDLAQKKLKELPTGGKTPLAAGLDLAYEVIMGLKMRELDIAPTLVLVSDGRASGKKQQGSNPFADALASAQRIGNQKIKTIILDTENDFIRFHLCAQLNEKMNGTLLTMEELRAEGIVEAIQTVR